MNSLSTRRRVKIVCTLGPASHTPVTLSTLIETGMDVARLNFSHGTHAFHQGLIATIREASKLKRKPIGIMQDLQGPKLRVGVLPKEGIELKAMFYGSSIFSVELPQFLELMVVKTEESESAAHVANATKIAILETGAKVEVPMFIESGDIIKVDTQTNEYIQRV